MRIYKLVRHFAGLQSLFYTLQQAILPSQYLFSLCSEFEPMSKGNSIHFSNEWPQSLNSQHFYRKLKTGYYSTTNQSKSLIMTIPEQRRFKAIVPINLLNPITLAKPYHTSLDLANLANSPLLQPWSGLQRARPPLHPCCCRHPHLLQPCLLCRKGLLRE